VAVEAISVELVLSDPAGLRTLYGRLLECSDGSGVEVHRRAGVPAPGSQGAVDYLVAVGGGAGLSALLRELHGFIKDFRSNAEVTVRCEDREITVSSANADQIDKLIDRVLPK
jgi:hypothetical protein